MADFTPAKNSSSPFPDMRGHHVAVRTPSLVEAKDYYVGKLDFRVLAEWDYADEQLAYLSPPTDDHFYIEVLGGGGKLSNEVRPYTDLGDSLKYRGYYHFCLNVVGTERLVSAHLSRILTDDYRYPPSRRWKRGTNEFTNLGCAGNSGDVVVRAGSRAAESLGVGG
jgi:glyoxylase I family protein